MHYALGQYSHGGTARGQAHRTRSRRVLGNEHPNTLTATSNLASVYRLQGKYAQAKLLSDECAEYVRRRVQGDQHLNTLTD